MVKKIIFTLFFLNSFLFAQSIVVKSLTDTTSYLIGDYIYYSIKITYDDDITPLTPVVKDSIPGLEFIFQEDIITGKKDNHLFQEYKFVFSKYDSGSVIIPPISVYYQIKDDTLLYTAKTNQHFIRVDLVEIDPEADIKDIKEPLTIPLDWKVILLWGTIILFALLVLYYLYKKFMGRKRIEEKIELIDIGKPPHEAALESLKILEGKKLWQNGYVKDYHTEITGIIRKYFEDRFEIPALKSTTVELLEDLSAKKEASDIILTTESFLSNADMVKFAKFQPMNEVNEQMMLQSYEIVNKTKVTLVQKNQVDENVR